MSPHPRQVEGSHPRGSDAVATTSAARPWQAEAIRSAARLESVEICTPCGNRDGYVGWKLGYHALAATLPPRLECVRPVGHPGPHMSSFRRSWLPRSKRYVRYTWPA